MLNECSKFIFRALVTPIVTRNFDIKNALFGKFARDSLGRDPRFEQKKLSDNSPGNIG